MGTEYSETVSGGPSLKLTLPLAVSQVDIQMSSPGFINRKHSRVISPEVASNVNTLIVASPVDSRSSSPDSFTKLLSEALDGPVSFLDTGHPKKHLILPAAPYIYGGVAALTTYAYGFNAGIIAAVLSSVQTNWGLSKDSLEVTFIVSAMLAGAVLGSLLPGWIGSDRVGRKPMLLVTNVILLVGAMASFLSENAVQLIISRTIIGLGIGVGSIMPGLYITEMSPTSVRGFLGILNQFSGFIGIISSYCAGLIFSETHWQRMFLLAGLMALIALIASASVLPESPRWLISRGSNQEAIKVLEKIYGRHNDHHSTEEFEKIYAHLSRPQTSSAKSSLSRKTLFTIVALQLIQQAAGSGFVTYYSASIFRSWGLSPRESTIATVFSALPQLLVFGIVAKWAEALGRKRLLLISEAAMAGVLFYLSLVTYLVGPEKVNHFQAGLVFIGLAGHRVAYALGLAPVPTVLIAEILPFSLRSHGLAVALTINWSLNFLITSLIPLAASANSLSVVYLSMGIFSLAAYYFVSNNISETRGVLLEANEEMHMFPVMPSDPDSRNQVFTSISIDSKALEPPKLP